jgi:tryptophanyl-tRNA synthetase
VSTPTLTPTSPASDLERRLHEHPHRFRVLTGDRPTGPLHIGHYFGTMRNRVRLQQLGVDVFVLIADYQAIHDRDAPASLPDDVLGLVADHLAVGLDPDRTTIFAHSQVEALNQLVLPFLSLVSVTEVGRNPTVKEEFAATGGEAMSALMFTYPVHQAADILACHGTVVPVGRDQLPHLELTRTIARRFNEHYARAAGSGRDGARAAGSGGDGAGEPYFTPPEPLLSEAPLLLGTDGRKMSKSRGNAIALAMDEDTTARLVRGARTDADRVVTYDPTGRPEVANLVLLASLCTGRPPGEIAESIGARGAAALKGLVTEALNEHLRPLRRRRGELAADRRHLADFLATGNERATAVAEATLTRVRELMHTVYA